MTLDVRQLEVGPFAENCYVAARRGAGEGVVVDRYELGPIGTNCYVVRRERGAEEAVVIDPGADARRAVDHEQPRVLLHLVVAELLAGIEPDEDGAGLVFAHEHHRRPRPAGGLDLGQPPRVHRGRQCSAPPVNVGELLAREK